MRPLPPIDLHAHIEADIAAADLLELGSLVFAATRSLDEAEHALERSDPWTIWGIGCHPGLVGAQKAFAPDRFAKLLSRTPYVSEVGLDGTSRVPLEIQYATFAAILTAVQATPRLTSIHSYAATDEILDCLTDRPIQVAVLHWWLGDREQTKRAVELGCYFSINASMLRRLELIHQLPLDRLFAETDHPFGDRSGARGRRPGNVSGVEAAIGRFHGLDQDEVRRAMWQNLADLVRLTRCGLLFPRPVRVAIAAMA